MSKLAAILGGLAVTVAIFFGVSYYLSSHQSKTDNQKVEYAKAYDAHALGEPFNLLSKTFENGRWLYVYQTTTPQDQAFAEVQRQLSGGGYQIRAAQPDTKDTVYRDLITGNITVTATVAPSASGATGINVYVTGIQY